MSKGSCCASVCPALQGDCRIARLLSWENPTTTGSLFLGFNLIYFFVFVLCKSLLSISCYFLLVPFAAGFVFRVLDLAPSFGEGPVEVVSKTTISAKVNCLYEKLNHSLESIRDILLWKNAAYSAKCCVLTWAAGYVSSFFSMYFIIFCLVWVAFGFSFVKKMCAPTVSMYVSPYIEQARELSHRVIGSIPRMDNVTK
ncbi:reticulon protein [Besnoitia besnoiti]|uniref:Reticulon-like protein n=1 Tax=Besnoitia besnoiti TaxID=94643 RepID=A0A2A9MIA2_BESBE|nr:reticulon protein [Besnoitia besnoiti]PFH35130.1 reticulon protein [Besnoitia besnoiti]